MFFVAGELAYSETLVVSRVENIPDQLMGSAIAKAALAKIDIELKFVDFPAKRALISSSSGEVDGELQRVYDVGNRFPSLIRVPTSYTYMDATAFGLKPDIKIDGWNSLKDFSVVRARGIVFAELGLEGHEKVVVVPTSESVFKLLVEGHVDLAISILHYGKFIAKKLSVKIYPLKPMLQRIPLYFYLHEKNAHLVEKIDAIFREMKDSGELERLRTIHFERTLRNASSASLYPYYK